MLDRRLAESEYIGGGEYSIADMAIWPWYGAALSGGAYNAVEFLQVDSYSNVQRWNAAIAARPAVQRGKRVNSTFGPDDQQMHERHDASDFDRFR